MKNEQEELKKTGQINVRTIIKTERDRLTEGSRKKWKLISTMRQKWDTGS